MTKLSTRLDRGSENSNVYWEKYQIEQNRKAVRKAEDRGYDVDPESWSKSVYSGDRYWAFQYRNAIFGYCVARPNAPYSEIKEFLDEWRDARW